MESRIQELTRSLYEDGVEKARQEAQTILAAAQAQADTIITDAQAKSQTIIEQARHEQDTLQKRLKAELHNAGQQALDAFKQELASTLEQAIIHTPIKNGLSQPEYLLDLVKSIIKAWVPQQNGQALIQLPASQEKELADWYTKALAETLTQGLVLRFNGRFSTGFRIGPQDSSWLVSFTDTELAALFQNQLKTMTKDLLFPDN